jgi:hypothetical protein
MMHNLVSSKFINAFMKESGDKKNQPDYRNFDFPESDLYDNLEFVVSEYEEENFYSFSGNENNDPDRDNLEL